MPDIVGAHCYVVTTGVYGTTEQKTVLYLVDEALRG